MKRHLKATKFFRVFPRCAGVFGQGICDGTNRGYDPIAVALSAGAVFFEDMLEEIGNEALRYGYPSSGAAYLVLESVESARRDGVRIRARIRDMRIRASASVSDPLSRRLGRTFAAAPAILMGMACCCGISEFSICGVDHQEFSAELEPAP
jgi:hypothetical protein